MSCAHRIVLSSDIILIDLIDFFLPLTDPIQGPFLRGARSQETELLITIVGFFDIECRK